MPTYCWALLRDAWTPVSDAIGAGLFRWRERIGELTVATPIQCVWLEFNDPPTRTLVRRISWRFGNQPTCGNGCNQSEAEELLSLVGMRKIVR